MKPMTTERAVNNAIVSTQMEGFVITEEIKKLIVKLMNEEITLDEALKQLNDSYNNSIKQDFYWQNKSSKIKGFGT